MTALDRAIADFRADPDMRRFDTTADLGGCWETAQRFAWHCAQRGVPYLFRKWRNLPGLRTRWQHNIEVDGQIICWTHRQIDTAAAWPHVEPFVSYRARFGRPQPICLRCGFRPHRARACPGIHRTSADALRTAYPAIAEGEVPHHPY